MRQTGLDQDTGAAGILKKNLNTYFTSDIPTATLLHKCVTSQLQEAEGFNYTLGQ